jgi:CBS domain-containing protein
MRCRSGYRLADNHNKVDLGIEITESDNLLYVAVSIFHHISTNIRKNQLQTMEDTMKVQDVMTRNVKSSRPESSLAHAASMMWDYDCGALPVVDDTERVLGMITDRDIAIAAATKGRPATEIAVGEVISGNVHTCAVDEDVDSALKTMRREKVRRLPVIGNDGKLAGILSINDVVLRAEEARVGQAAEISYEDVMSTFKAVCEHSRAYQTGGA